MLTHRTYVRYGIRHIVALPHQPSFDDLSTPLFDVVFCVLDLETTGGSPRDCEITEVGAVKFHHGEHIGSFQTLVDPGAPIPASITMLTGITHAMVYDAPRIEAVFPAFAEFIGGSVIVGHNVRFDMAFLDRAADRLGFERLGNDRVDTAALARRLVRDEVRNLRLQSLAAHFRSPVVPNHRALEDARATAHVLHGLLERAGTLGVTNLDDLLALPRAQGSRFYEKIRLTDSLPAAPGVYLFRDRNGHVIYVGKATNLRQRVRQYFYGDTRKTIGNMMRELASIEHQTCATLIEAEVTELRLIHSNKPRYNRRSRPPKTSHFVRLTREEYPRLSVVRGVRSDALAHIGPFRSKKAADLVMLAIWDSIPVRRCRDRPGSGRGPCAGAQLGVASCPCDGTLDRATYRRIVDELIRGIESEPQLLLQPLREKMRRYASDRRFEEAGSMRDRHDALARALQRRFEWRALQEAGWFEIGSGSGAHAVIDHGILVASWEHGGTAPLLTVSAGDSRGSPSDVPGSVEIAEEASLIWRWMTSDATLLHDSTGPLALPAHRAQLLRESPAA